MSERPPEQKQGSRTGATSFFDTLRIGVLASVPALTALVFVIVAVKVFRASMMETTTTNAIVSTADVWALLKGVILSLLPGFLAALVAVSIWWWAAVLPGRLDGKDVQEQARHGLLSPQAVWAWAMIVAAFFTVWWPIFLVLLVPVLATTAALATLSVREQPPVARSFSPRRKLVVYALVPLAVVVFLLVVKVALGLSWAAFTIVLVPLLVLPEAVLFAWQPPAGITIALSRTLKIFGLVAAAVFIGLLTLAPTVWLPLRTITFTAEPYTLNGRTLPPRIAAYVLSQDDNGASLLLSNPRAVIQVRAGDIEEAMPLCVPPESRLRVLTVRASQVLGIDTDPHSPYEVCPEIPQRLLGGG